MPKINITHFVKNKSLRLDSKIFRVNAGNREVLYSGIG